jgi:hypothetical protein
LVHFLSLLRLLVAIPISAFQLSGSGISAFSLPVFPLCFLRFLLFPVPYPRQSWSRPPVRLSLGEGGKGPAEAQALAMADAAICGQPSPLSRGLSFSLSAFQPFYALQSGRITHFREDFPISVSVCDNLWLFSVPVAARRSVFFAVKSPLTTSN